MRFELRRPFSHRSEAKMDPRTQLTGPPLGAAGSKQNGPPVQSPRQRQLSQLQQDIRSSWRWFLHRSHGLTGHSLKWFQGRDKSFQTWGPMTRYSARRVLAIVQEIGK